MDMKRGRVDFAVGRFFCLWSLAALGFWWWLGQERTGLRQLQQTGVIRIGYAVEAPYAFLSPEGRVTGEAPEIARVVVERLKIGRIHWRVTEFTNLIEELRAGQFDVIAAGLFITPERQEQVRFSRPTFRAAPALLVPRSAQLTQYPVSRQEFPRPVAVLSGSAEEARWLSGGNAPEDLLITPDAHAASISLQQGKAGSVALSAPSLGWMSLGHPDWEVLQDHRATADLGGFAFRLEDHKLVQAWNEQLGRYLGSPEHLALVKSFGFEKRDLP